MSRRQVRKRRKRDEKTYNSRRNVADALQFILLLDKFIADAFKNLAPYKSAYSLDNIRSISNSLEHSKTVVANTANWLEKQDDPIDPVIWQRMQALPDAPPPRAVALA